jgi:hypothetical protein
MKREKDEVGPCRVEQNKIETFTLVLLKARRLGPTLISVLWKKMPGGTQNYE